MQQVFMVLGYGVPKDMESDVNYTIYLRLIFNTIFTKAQGKPATILFSGGETDCIPPYTRNEAEEMAEYVKDLAARNDVAPFTKQWKIALEQKSISTLENIIYLEKMLRARRLDRAQLTLFCEATRVTRIAKIVKKIFGKKKLTIIDIDFDQSKNRYLDLKDRKKIEKELLDFDLWALKSPANLKQHHARTLQKITYLRKNAGKMPHADAIRKWRQELSVATLTKKGS